MDSSSIQLSGSEIEAIDLVDGSLRIRFSKAYLVKTMTGSEERTLWWQAGTLVMDGAEPEAPLPQAPAVCDGGDIDDNIYTYRDMIPIPLNSRGHVRCDLGLRGTGERVLATAETLRLDMIDTPRYIRHLRD